MLQKTGARIKIFSNLAPQSTDRVIQIIGEAQQCIDTIREVLTLIKQVSLYLIYLKNILIVENVKTILQHFVISLITLCLNKVIT